MLAAVAALAAAAITAIFLDEWRHVGTTVYTPIARRPRPPRVRAYEVHLLEYVGEFMTEREARLWVESQVQPELYSIVPVWRELA